MAKTITLKFEGVEYTLEFTRRTVKTLENQGLIVSDVETKPMSTLPVLFSGAFLAHHRYVKQETIDKIFSRISNKQEFLGKLAELYNEPLRTLVDEPEETEGNATWAASW